MPEGIDVPGITTEPLGNIWVPLGRLAPVPMFVPAGNMIPGGTTTSDAALTPVGICAPGGRMVPGGIMYL